MLSAQNSLYDQNFPVSEQIPRKMVLKFEEKILNNLASVSVFLGDKQVGDIVNDNSHLDDYYRYHDIFHISFATFLGWSPCMRKMLGCKRKSDFETDEIEDGARSRIIEEAISMIIFENASRNNYFKTTEVSDDLLVQIMGLIKNREVANRTKEEWKHSISEAYRIWNHLVLNRGGYVEADLEARKLGYRKSV